MKLMPEGATDSRYFWYHKSRKKPFMNLDALKYDARGLIPAVVQEAGTGEVLMVAWMNRQSLELTLSTGYTHFWSRSRNKLWKKGETSGDVQEVKDIFFDCDADTLLVKVIQRGKGACHTGHRSCFYRNIREAEIKGE